LLLNSQLAAAQLIDFLMFAEHDFKDIRWTAAGFGVYTLREVGSLSVELFAPFWVIAVVLAALPFSRAIS
jgi:hypothetical protein